MLVNCKSNMLLCNNPPACSVETGFLKSQKYRFILLYVDGAQEVLSQQNRGP